MIYLLGGSGYVGSAYARLRAIAEAESGLILLPEFEILPARGLEHLVAGIAVREFHEARWSNYDRKSTGRRRYSSPAKQCAFARDLTYLKAYPRLCTGFRAGPQPRPT